MTTPKLPEPVAAWAHPDAEESGEYYTAYQVREYARSVLEIAAKVAQETVCDTHIPTGIDIYGTRAAKSIRALKEQL